MEVLKNIKKGILQGIGILLVLILSGATYAAWTALSQETDGQPLTAAKWNAVIDRLNSIDQKQLATAWVNFNGASCTGGAGLNECLIRSKYNISKVIRISAGIFEIYFESPMSNDYYSSVGNTNAYSLRNSYGGYGGTSTLYNQTMSNFRMIVTNQYNNTVVDAIENSIQVFGGK